jgi:uncharacterized OsmC-like protein
MDNNAQYFIRYRGDLIAYALHKKSGDLVRTDAPEDNRGKARHFSPTDLVAVALGNCILTVMGIKAADAGIDIVGAEAEVQKVMAANPRRIAKITVSIKMPARDYSDKEKKILEKFAHHCPVRNSLHPELEEEINFSWQ